MGSKKIKDRKKQNNNMLYIKVGVCVVLLLAVIMLLKGCISFVTKTIHREVEGETQTEKTLSAEEMEQYIQDNLGEYPDFLHETYKKYPETLEFVYYYPEKHNREYNFDLSEEYKKGEIPLFIQWDERWGYVPYGDAVIGTAGCGPTCLSMVYVGLTGDTSKDPTVIAQMAEEKGYYVDGSGTTWDIFNLGAKDLGLTVTEVGLSPESVREQVEQGHPVVINVSKGVFTKSGHYLIISGTDGDNFRVNDPNSIKNSEKSWAWDDFADQIRGLWAFSKAPD